MATNNEDFEDDNEQNEQELEQTDDQDKRKRYFSKECKFWLARFTCVCESSIFIYKLI